MKTVFIILTATALSCFHQLEQQPVPSEMPAAAARLMAEKAQQADAEVAALLSQYEQPGFDPMAAVVFDPIEGEQP